MRKWLGQLLNDDNDRADEMVLLAVLSVFTFLGMTIYAVVWLHQPWIPNDYGDGIGKVLGAAMIGMGIKKRLGA